MATERQAVALPQRGQLMMLAASLFLGGMLFVEFLRAAILQPTTWMPWTGVGCVLAGVGIDVYIINQRLRRIDHALSAENGAWRVRIRPSRLTIAEAGQGSMLKRAACAIWVQPCRLL